MKLIAASDIHVNSGHLPGLLWRAEEKKSDAVIIVGDICPKLNVKKDLWHERMSLYNNYIRRETLPELIDFKMRNPQAQIYIDMGNGDMKGNRHILEDSADSGDFALLHMIKHALTPGVDIIGYMNVPVKPGGIKDWEKPDTKISPCLSDDYCIHGITSVGGIKEVCLDLGSDDTIETDMEILSGMIDKPFIFACHAAPNIGSLDILWNGTHAGSKAIAGFIEKWAKKGMLKLSLHGHIHESPGIEWVYSTPVINMGQQVDTLSSLEFEIDGTTVTVNEIKNAEGVMVN